jgi:hypothetical protein
VGSFEDVAGLEQGVDLRGGDEDGVGVVGFEHRVTCR